MSINGIAILKQLDPIFDLYKEPLMGLSHHADQTHRQLCRGLESSIESESDQQQALINAGSLLSGVTMKLRAVYYEWVRGKLIYPEREARHLTLSINYDIYEAILHLTRIGEHYLQGLMDDGKVGDDLRVSLHYQLRRMFFADYRFANPGTLKDDIIVTKEEEELIRAGKSMPLLDLAKLEPYLNTGLPTFLNFRHELPEDTDTGTAHDSIFKMMDFCYRIESIFEHYPAEEFLGYSSFHRRQIIESLLKSLIKWDSNTVLILLNDERALFREYGYAKDAKKDIASYPLWREQILHRIVTPDIHLSEVVC